MVRADSPLVLATAGTIAVHLLLAVAGDALVITHPYHPSEPPPKVQFVKIDPPKRKPPEPPKPKTVEDKPVDAPKPPPTPKRQQQVAAKPAAARAPEIAPPVPTTNTAPSGGDMVVSIPDISQTTNGVPVKQGPLREGSGTGAVRGTGTGGGAGSGEVAKPVSVATIKTAAKPKGDYDYVSIGKDYPAEAQQLGIEGDIRVKLTVDESGKVSAAVLLNRLGHGLDELALERARKIAFEPARDSSDHAVASVVVWTFHMTLPKS